MKHNVLLYIRVSTDEQADKGYSQRYQDEMLRRFCQVNDLNIAGVFFEDYSAKTFIRPEFKKMLLMIRKSKGTLASQLLFIKWDRFSRTASDAYQMIATLKKLGVSVNATEQPLDLSVPENKLMLAFYLAAPEVENDRRAMNIYSGMIRAKKEGRFMGMAPIGYVNKTINEKKQIVKTDKEKYIRFIFETIAEKKYSSESILKKVREMGLTCSKNNFWNILRNPVYAGFIPVPAMNGQPAYMQQGQHEAIISPALFYLVQDILDGRHKKQREKLKFDDQFPLRGLIRCTSCGATLTASTSLNKRKQPYSYYHCTSRCGQRYRAELVNEQMVRELHKLKPHPAVKELLKLVALNMTRELRQQTTRDLKRIKEELILVTREKEKALKLLLAESIEADDYSLIKNQSEQATFKLEKELADLSQLSGDNPMIEECITVLEDLPNLYASSTAEQKREILCSMFTEKLEFSKLGFRTLPLNEAMQLIFNTGAAFRQNKNGQTGLNFSLSHQVNPLVRFSNTIIFQFRKIAALKRVA